MKGAGSRRRPSTRPAGTASKPKLRKFTAFHLLYEPFRMGGGPWIKRTFEVEAEPVKLGRAFDGFIFFDKKHTKVWRVYEAKSGGFIAGHVDRNEAIAQAIYDIKRTPDFKQQRDKLLEDGGEAGDMDEILRRVHKSSERKKAEAEQKKKADDGE